MTTQFAQASYQEIIDLNTESNSVSAIGIHTPSSSTPVDMLQGFWKQFQKVRYDGCSITLVPAARLPVDPLGVSYEAGESQIDPRDLLNPIMFHGCHGNDMGDILNELYSGPGTTTWRNNLGVSDSIEQSAFLKFDTDDQTSVAEALYYKAMTDNTWKKADPQRGFKKSGLRPLVHDLAVNVPLGVSKIGRTNGAGNRYDTALPTHLAGSADDTEISTSDFGLASNTSTSPYLATGFPKTTWTPASSLLPSNYLELQSTRDGVQFMTNRLRSLGWLDTQSPFARVSNVISWDTDDTVVDKFATAIAGDQDASHACQNTIPKLFMGMILLPPAYKTKQYYRMVINHRFSFAKFRGISMMNFTESEVKHAYGYTNNMRNV